MLSDIVVLSDFYFFSPFGDKARETKTRNEVLFDFEIYPKCGHSKTKRFELKAETPTVARQSDKKQLFWKRTL